QEQGHHTVSYTGFHRRTFPLVSNPCCNQPRLHVPTSSLQCENLGFDKLSRTFPSKSEQKSPQSFSLEACCSDPGRSFQDHHRDQEQCIRKEIGLSRNDILDPR